MLEVLDQCSARAMTVEDRKALEDVRDDAFEMALALHRIATAAVPGRYLHDQASLALRRFCGSSDPKTLFSHLSKG